MLHFVDSVRTSIAAHSLLQKGESCIVALSGGADSVALLLVMLELGYRVEAAHCNFHLRGEDSDRDEAFCRKLCQEAGVLLHVRHFDTVAEARSCGESIEMAARRLRYAWFDVLCRERECTAVCVGHHRDDNVETLLLNLVRGTGIHGLTGMARRREAIVRPLLDVSHTEILAFLQQKRQAFVTDCTNTDVRYKRNFVRHELLPLLRQLNPSVEETLLADMDKLRAAEETYDMLYATTFGSIAETADYGWSIDLSRLACRAQYDAIGKRFGFPEAVVKDLVRHRELSERAHYESPGYVAAVRNGRLEVVRTPETYCFGPLVPGETVNLPGEKRLMLRLVDRQDLAEIPRASYVAAIDSGRVSGALFCRNVQRGDRFRPFGMKGTKLVSDYLTDRRQSQVARLWASVLCDAEGILWLVGHRIDQRAAITAATERVLIVTCEKNAAAEVREKQ